MGPNLRSGALLLLFAAGPGCAIRSNPPRPYFEEWQKGQNQLLKEDYGGARATFQNLLGRFPDEELNQHAELLLADCEYHLGNVARARTLRERVAAQARTPRVKADALAGMGMLELEEERYQPAAARFVEAGKLEPAAASRARHLLHGGIAFQRAGQFEEARALYREALALAPGTKTATRCQEQLLYPDHFCVQAGAFSDQANAARQRDLLVEKGFPAEVVAVNAPGGKRHCVRVGRFAERAQAAALRDRILATKVLPLSARMAVKP